MKTFFNIPILLFYLLFTQSCDSLAGSESKTTGKPQKLAGYYIYGHEVNTFQPCGQTLIYWVNGSNDVLVQLEMEYTKLVSQPYAEVYMEMTGTFTGKAADGFARDYDGQIWISKLSAMQIKTGDNCR